jgi:hypothetical protein
VVASPARANDSAAATSAIYSLAWLVGGTWTSLGPGLPDGVARIEVRYNRSFTHTFIQFATDFVGTMGGRAGSYAGNFYFDPASGGLRMWYMDQDNSITQGPVEISGGSINMRFSGPGRVAGVNGNVDFRVQVTQTTPDTYHWVLFANPQGNWKQLFSLDYVHSV